MMYKDTIALVTADICLYSVIIINDFLTFHDFNWCQKNINDLIPYVKVVITLQLAFDSLL